MLCSVITSMYTDCFAIAERVQGVNYVIMSDWYFV